MVRFNMFTYLIIIPAFHGDHVKVVFAVTEIFLGDFQSLIKTKR